MIWDMTTNSLFPVHKDQIKKASDNAVEFIENERNRLFEEEVDKVMNRKVFKPSTRGKAKKIVIERDCSDLRFVSWLQKYFHERMTATKLNNALKAMSMEQNLAYLSKEDAEFVQKFS